ncbi:MAG: HAD family phosphatase [Candidatus Pacebacteria bacterium]|nr:HAD family phosphatase [Candidatus Paceibacterota bacterium]
MIKAVIFDMDGVISDTQKLHASIEVDLLKKYGVFVTAEEITKNYNGLPDKVFFEKIFKAYNVLADIDSIRKEKWEKMMVSAPGNIFAIPGAVKIINDLRLMGLKLGVASSSSAEFVELVLSELEIKNNFDAITSTAEVKFGKPNPDIFLLAAKKLGADPKECVVIEDAISGMTAAKSAGMMCVGLIHDDRNYPADLTVTTLEDLTVEKIINLK